MSGRSHVLCNVMLAQWGHFHGHLCLLFLCLSRNVAFLSFLCVKGRQINPPVLSMKGFVRKNMTKSGCFLVFRMGAITKWRNTEIDNNPMKHLKAVILVEPQLKYPESQQNGTVPLGGKFSPVFEKCAKVIFKLGTGHYLSPGGEDSGLINMKFSQSPPLIVTSLKWSGPSNNFWCFSRSPPPPPPPPCLHFPSKFQWSPLWILLKFPVIPPFGFPVSTDSPFFSSKNRLIPRKIVCSPPPHPPSAINNDRSLRSQNILVDSFAIPAKIYRMHAWELRLIVFWYRRDPERLLLGSFITTSNKATLTYNWKFFTSDRSWVVLWMESMAQQVIPRVFFSLDYFGAR